MTEPMSEPMTAPIVQPQTFLGPKRTGFGKWDLVEITGTRYIHPRNEDWGVRMAREDAPDLYESFSNERLEELAALGQIRIHRKWFHPGKSLTLGRNDGDIGLGDLTPGHRRLVLAREFFVKHQMIEEEEGLATRSDASMRLSIARGYPKYLEWAKGQQPGSRRWSRKSEFFDMPSPGRLREWLRLYEAADCNPLVLTTRYHKCGNRTPRINDEKVLEIMARWARRYADETRPSKASLYARMKGEIETLSAQREAEGLKPYKVPSLRTFERAIDRLDRFLVLSGRLGEKAAKEKLRIVGRGRALYRAGERIEIDEWTVTLQSLPIPAEQWDKLPDHLRKKIQRERLLISVAICAMTRYILAVRVSYTATASNALATLGMAVRDRTDIAKACGCESEWSAAPSPEEVGSDTGSGYLNEFWVTAVADLGAHLDMGIAARPEGRAHVERNHRTLDQRFAAFFTGRTFENVVAKGDYDAEARASLLSEEVGPAVVRFCVDVTNNTPHASLAGETPRNAWNRLAREKWVVPGPDAERHRHIFGLATTRRITNTGVRIFGLTYRSRDLAELRRDNPHREYQVRVDRENLGEISLRRPDGAWISVRCDVDDMQGVALATWLAASRALRRRNADVSALSAAIVNKAIRDLHALGETARLRAGIGPSTVSDEDILNEECDLYRSFAIGDATKRRSFLDDDMDAADDDGEETASGADPASDAASAARAEDTAPAEDAAPDTAPQVRRRRGNRTDFLGDN